MHPGCSLWIPSPREMRLSIAPMALVRPGCAHEAPGKAMHREESDYNMPGLSFPGPFSPFSACLH